jgi:hypothetical protein
MAKLKPWFHVVQPREDLRSGKPLDASEFAVHLDHVREGRAPDVYIKPDLFFQRTYLTRTLLFFSAQVVRRLSGIQIGTSAVFNMATQFGGGKTHSLTLLYHLAKAGPAADGWQGVHHILRRAEVPTTPKANTAVFVGTEFDSLVGRGGDDGTPRRMTPWGEIAWQLGGPVSFQKVAEHDAQRVAPAGDVIRAFLPSGPCLILLDELMNFISSNRKNGLAAQTYNFLQNLAEEATARTNVVLAVSVPASELEMNQEDQADHDRLKKMLDRKGKAVIMSSDVETSEIIRRRLFEWGGLPDEGVRTANEYANWAVDHRQLLGNVDIDTIRERFQSAYPFHPSVLSVFETKWQALPRFQRTRGILRLLALWVSRAYDEGFRGNHRDPLIGLGTAPLEDSYFRAAMFEQLGTDQLEGSVTNDISGQKGAISERLDKESDEVIRKSRLHRKVAATIFFESNGGMTRAEATLPEIRFAVGEPGLDIANVENVLENLVRKCHYMVSEHNRYRFSMIPNLNRVLTDRRASIQDPAIDERVRQEIQAVFKLGVPSITRVYFPEKSIEVPNRAALTLVVLPPERSMTDAAETRKFAEQILRECGTTGRTFKSAILFSVPDSAAALRDAARELLAYEDIEADDDTIKRLDDGQLRQLKTGCRNAARDMKESVWRAYKYLMLLDRDNSLQEIDFGQVNSSMAGTIAEMIVNRLIQDDVITETASARTLVRNWPPAVTAWSTKAVRDAFFSSPVLPRLMDPGAIRRTIVDGVAQKILAYVGKGDGGRYEPFYFGTSLSEADIDISDDMYLLTGAEAAKYVEPARLTKLQIIASSTQVKPGCEITLSAKGYDQHGRPFTPSHIIWSASLGTIDEEGRYTAPMEPGICSIIAEVDGVIATTQVKVVDSAPNAGKQPENVIRPEPVSNSGYRWEGVVPHQKWMNLYTKVVAKLISTPGVTLKVGIDLSPGGNIDDTKLEEIRMALRELGLNDNLRRIY